MQSENLAPQFKSRILLNPFLHSKMRETITPNLATTQNCYEVVKKEHVSTKTMVQINKKHECARAHTHTHTGQEQSVPYLGNPPSFDSWSRRTPKTRY